ncbi:lipid droplet-associated hydrolase [Planococcus citri]|uniref:lipid droplet-associated hydrolase n=1 Tax=Planococcus citri TaxID=170843 RepID=UPI0031F8A6AC
MYKENWSIVEDVPTRILTWGADLDELKSNKDKYTEMIFVITGNPGIADFYIEFLNKLHELVQIPIWVISHAGHEIPENIEAVYGTRKDEFGQRMYDLQQQIDHKAAAIRNLVPKDCKLYIIGHSMGAKVALELVKTPELEKRIEKCYMLFPTVEHIGRTPNAAFIKPFIKYFGTVVIFLSWIFTLFPVALKKIMLKCTFTLTHGAANSCTVSGGMKLIQPAVLRNIFHLTKDEMIEIKDLDVENLRKFRNKFKFYYGTTDGWSPLKFYEHLIQEIPEMDAEVCCQGIKHAFTIKSAHTMSEMISNWIKAAMAE